MYAQLKNKPLHFLSGLSRYYRFLSLEKDTAANREIVIYPESVLFSKNPSGHPVFKKDHLEN